MADLTNVKMTILPVPVLTDNYAYILYDQVTGVGAAVDPAEPQKVLAAAQKAGVTITTILTTHHHGDHAGGNELMCKLVPGLTVVGADDRIPSLNHRVNDGDTVKVGAITVTCRFTPCHTSGHVLFIAQGNQQDPQALFSGDTLFIAGCGKFFEGTAAQMNYALNTVVAGLPKNTQVWCGHEYTLSNFKFASSVDPNNTALQAKYAWALTERNEGRPTIPSTVGDELSYNPFMRASVADIKKAVGSVQDSDDDTMAKLRTAKNEFK